MAKKILLIHELSLPLSHVFCNEDDWEMTVSTYSELAETVRASKFDAILLDLNAPATVCGYGVFEDIVNYESDGGKATAYLAALRLKAVCRETRIVVLGDLPGRQNIIVDTLFVRCKRHEVYCGDLLEIENIIHFINGVSGDRHQISYC